MTDRERLIELIKEMENHPEKTCPHFNEEDCFNCPYDKEETCDMAARKADYILSDGWIRPPCKVGDTVWAIALTGKLYKYTINGVHQFEDKHFMFGGYRIREDGKKVNPTWQDSEIGRIVFIGATAKEEAEKALAEREGSQCEQ